VGAAYALIAYFATLWVASLLARRRAAVPNADPASKSAAGGAPPETVPPLDTTG
jgi:hypothetical protein